MSIEDTKKFILDKCDHPDRISFMEHGLILFIYVDGKMLCSIFNDEAQNRDILWRYVYFLDCTFRLIDEYFSK